MASEQRGNPLARIDAFAVTARYRRGQEICTPAKAAERWYRVVSGAVRWCALRADGRRQIVDLVWPDNFFGFSESVGYDFAVEALMHDTVVASYPRRRLELLADSDPQVAREIRRIAFNAISRLQSQLVLLGQMNAQEKVGSFLVDMAHRLSDDADNVVLPISRHDIADYLAISVETVSRTLTSLKERGLIKLVSARNVRIVDRDALLVRDSMLAAHLSDN
jgi:CRP/FNR family nitrogen fixation transcriptional regulator